MAVSKRTRFEVLRRDNFTCRYCRGTEGQLTVDHVTPVALGGTDDPSNLVAACRDCNSGKASTGPNESTVADVSDDELRWAAALAKAAEITDAKAVESQAVIEEFEAHWFSRPGYVAPMPHDWPNSVLNFRSLGLGMTALLESVDIATTRPGVAPSARWRYFCGICWTKVRELQEMARQILAAEEA